MDQENPQTPNAETDQISQQPAQMSEADRRALLPEAAQRALAEADARRSEASKSADRPVELGGRDGPEPVRFGDWEKKGIAIDF